MQRLYEMQGEQKTSDFFNSSDHPDTEKRRDNYEKKLHEYSRKHVAIKNGAIFINGKYFTTVAPSDSMSSLERSYFIFGNLAKLYHHSQMYSDACVKDETVMIGDHPVMTPIKGDESAEVLVKRLNEIR